MEAHVARQITPLAGTVRPPADKSISHRAVLFAAMAEGVSHLTGVLDSADVRSTMAAVSALGAHVAVTAVTTQGLTCEIIGWGRGGPCTPAGPIDCGNSGTTTRLLAGVLAGWPVDVTLIGDESLSSRPMRRISEPLAAMGARIELTETGTLPLRIIGGALMAIDYASPVASAQVKSAILLAGLRASGTTTVTEPARSRDHTERMLPAFGVPVIVENSDTSASVVGPARLGACDVTVPADPSSAAFLAVAAAVVVGSHVRLSAVSLNPTRSGFVRVLEDMGASVLTIDRTAMGAEDVASLQVRHTPGLHATTITADQVPSLIDEIPILAVAATQAAGTTRFEGIGELRVKESDRLEAIAEGLRAFGAQVRTEQDSLEVSGPVALRAARVRSRGDHRLAMAWAIAGLLAEGETVVDGFDAVDVSYPGFADHLSRIGASISVR